VGADTFAAILTLVLLALVILLLSGPFRPGHESRARPHMTAPQERNALEAEREAKYREIRDAELDFRTGKLSAEDHELIVATLRTEAAEILRRLRRLDGDAARAEATGEGRARAADPARRRDEPRLRDEPPDD
jgi:hypothetical protein